MIGRLRGSVHAEVEEFTDYGKHQRDRRRAAFGLRARARCVVFDQSQRRLGGESRHGYVACFHLVGSRASTNPRNSGRTKHSQEPSQSDEAGDTHGSEAEHCVPSRVPRSLEGEVSSVPHPVNGTWSDAPEGAHRTPLWALPRVDGQRNLSQSRSPLARAQGSRARLPRARDIETTR
jgi:hypothetical protein